jgi:DNA-binding NtrC family response regulator
MSGVQPVTVLVVDDDPDQLLVRCMLLSHHGFDTRGASEAGSALEIATTQKPAVAVIDLRIPTEDVGFLLLRELKAVLPELRVIVFTGLDADSLAGKPELGLIEEILQKGRSSGALVRTLNRVTARRVS